MSEKKELEFFEMLNALQLALLDPLISEAEEDIIMTKIKKLIRSRKRSNRTVTS